MTTIYNEIDEYAARWIGNLIVAGHVAPGSVDSRSIVDLVAEDVRNARQAHFFAGIAVWSAAARAAGWPDDAPLWTGSCPCQPFSQAGRGKGTDDERHLWPEWFRLIRECRPPVIIGEQVASPAGLGWLDAVFADLEGAGYACAAVDFGAASVGAPHQRQRLYFVAVADGERLEGLRIQLRERGPRSTVPQVGGRGEAGRVADSDGCRFGPNERDVSAREPDATWSGPAGDMADDTKLGRQERRNSSSEDRAGSFDDRAPSRLGDSSGSRHNGRKDATTDRGDAKSSTQATGRRTSGNIQSERASADDRSGMADAERHDGTGRIAQAHGRTPLESDRHGDARGPGAMANADEPHPLHGNQPGSWRLVQPAPHATAGFWSPADWIPCLDGKARPVEPGTFPLAHGATARVGRLRAYGNAIVRPQAQAFLEVVIEMITATADPTQQLKKAVNL